MCDYSLHLVTSRVITRGFAAIGEPNVAVCLLPGTGLRESWICVTGSAEMRYTVMSAPISDDESSEHQKYAPKRLRDAATTPPGLTAPRHFAAHISLARTSAWRPWRNIRVPFLRRRFGRQVVPTTV